MEYYQSNVHADYIEMEIDEQTQCINRQHVQYNYLGQLEQQNDQIDDQQQYQQRQSIQYEYDYSNKNEQDIQQQLMMIVQKQIQVQINYEGLMDDQKNQQDNQLTDPQNNYDQQLTQMQMLISSQSQSSSLLINPKQKNNLYHKDQQNNIDYYQSDKNQIKKSLIKQNNSINNYQFQQLTVVNRFIKKLLMLKGNKPINNQTIQHTQNINQINQKNQQKQLQTFKYQKLLNQQQSIYNRSLIKSKDHSIQQHINKQSNTSYIHTIIQFLISFSIIISNYMQSLINRRLYFLIYAQQKMTNLNKWIYTLLINYRVLKIIEKVIYRKVYLQWIGGIVLNNKVKCNKGEQYQYSQNQDPLIDQRQHKQNNKQVIFKKLKERILEIVSFTIQRLFMLSLSDILIFNSNNNNFNNNNNINTIVNQIKSKREQKNNQIIEINFIIEKQLFMSTVIKSIVNLIKWFVGLSIVMVAILIVQCMFNEQLYLISDDNQLQSTVHNLNDSSGNETSLSYLTYTIIMGIFLSLMVIIVMSKLLSTIINTIVFFIFLHRNQSNNNKQTKYHNVTSPNIQQLSKFVNIFILCSYQHLHDMNVSQNITLNNNIKQNQQYKNSLLKPLFNNEYNGIQQIVNLLSTYHNKINKLQQFISKQQQQQSITSIKRDNLYQQYKQKQQLSLSQVKQVTQMIITNYNNSYVNKLNQIFKQINKQLINLQTKQYIQSQEQQQSDQQYKHCRQQQFNCIVQLKIGSLHQLMLLRKMPKLFQQHICYYISYFIKLTSHIIIKINQYYQSQSIWYQLKGINYIYNRIQMLRQYHKKYNKIMRQFIQQCDQILALNGIVSSLSQYEQHITTLNNNNKSSALIDNKQPQLFISLNEYNRLITDSAQQQRQQNSAQHQLLNSNNNLNLNNNTNSNKNNNKSLLQQVQFTNQLLQFYHIFLLIAKLKLNHMVQNYQLTQKEQNNSYNNKKDQQLQEITNFITYIQQSLSLKVFLLKSKLSTIKSKQFTTFKRMKLDQNQNQQQLFTSLNKQTQSQFIIKDNHVLLSSMQQLINSHKPYQPSRYLKITTSLSNNHQLNHNLHQQQQQQYLNQQQQQQQIVYQQFVKNQNILQTLDTLVERLVQKQNQFNQNNNGNQHIYSLKQNSSSLNYYNERYQSSSSQSSSQDSNQLSSSQQQDQSYSTKPPTSNNSIFSNKQFTFNFNLQKQMSQLFTQINKNNNNSNNNDQSRLNQIKQYQ